MLLFVGDDIVGYWVEEPSKLNGESVEYVKSSLDIKEQTNEILRSRNEKINYVVYDLEQYSISAAEIVAEIYNIYQAGNAEPIFLATAFLPSSDLIVRLQERGFNKFIFEYSDGKKKSELEKCMNGYYDVQKPENLLDVAEKITIQKKRTMIGVGGACQRMGTTTQAMQLVKHLLYCGKKACYIEVNSTRFIQELLNTFEVEEHNENVGKVRFSNIDLYYRQELIPEVLQMDYDYYVYDYGVFNSKDFNKVSFLEKDIKIMVLGSNPGELQKSTELIDSVFYQNVNYIFNFTAPSDQEDLVANMGDKGQQTYFMNYCPDMFIYVPAKYYDYIFEQIGDDFSEKPNDTKKSKWPWGRKKKG